MRVMKSARRDQRQAGDFQTGLNSATAHDWHLVAEREPDMPVEEDLKHLRRCVELARQALQAGDEPFGSVLVDAEGKVLMEDHNRVAGGDRTRHPEFALARWAAENMTPEERAAATVYTSGEHCPMCAAAHGWVGLGRIVYAASSRQLNQWLEAFGVPPGPVRSYPIQDIVPDAVVEGPFPELEEEVRELHRHYHLRSRN